MNLRSGLVFVAAVLGLGGTANASEKKFRIALKAETVAGGKVRIGVENRSEVLLRCRYLQPDGRISEIDPLAPGTTFWIGVVAGPAGKWNCHRSTKDPPQLPKLLKKRD